MKAINLIKYLIVILDTHSTSVEMDKKELENSALYEKLVTDLGRVSTRFQGWWDEKSEKYKWESAPGAHWEIDFDTCDIYLVTGG
jgi:CXXX repeat modification system protein